MGDLVTAGLLVSSLLAALAGQQRPFSLEETTIARIDAALGSQTLNCRALIELYLDRIEQRTPTTPTGVGRINPGPLAIADEVDRRFRETGIRGRLHCVPLVVDGLDPFLLGRFIEAGAVVLGAASPPAPNGSTDAIAVAVDAGFAVAGVSATSVTLSAPASTAGLVEIRPASTFDRGVRIVARQVADAVAVLRVIAETRPSPPLNRDSSGAAPLDDRALKGARLGSVHELYEHPGLDRRVLDLFNGAVGELGNLGATIVERAALDANSQSGTGLARTGDSSDSLRRRLLELMDRLELDALVYPTSSAPPAGLPSAIVPMGYTRDRTLRPGLQFVGRPGDDLALIRLAYSYEQATNHRRPPR